MKEVLIGIIEIIGNSFECLSNSHNPKKTVLVVIGLFLIVMAILYFLTKDFNSLNVISQ